MGYLGNGLPIFLALSNQFGWITERENSQNIQVFRDSEELIYIRHSGKPAQVESTPSDHAGRIIDWIALLASDTAKGDLSTATIIFTFLFTRVTQFNA